MPHHITYSASENYRQTGIGIVLPVRLRWAGNEVRLEAKIDTGADFCIFERIYAETLGLDVESGVRQSFGAVTGDFVAYGHEVTLVAMGFELTGICYFFETGETRKNVLGRNGWLNKIRLGIDDTGQPGTLYASQP